VKIDLWKRIQKRIDTYEGDMIDLQKTLTAIPALGPENGGDGEYDKAMFLLDYLSGQGFTDIVQLNACDRRVSSGLRPNIIVRASAANSVEETVWILTHTDIVPPGEPLLWDSNPYELSLKDGKLYGRGTEDNHQDLVASLFAAKAFLDEGIAPSRNIGLAFVADEETSSRMGLVHLLAHSENPFRRTDLIVVPDGGNEDGSLIEVAEKSILWLKIRTSGKQCHASRPSRGINAFAVASHLIVRLKELSEEFHAADGLFDPPQSTFEATKKEANIPNINTIPGDDVFYLDCRVLPAYSLQDVLSAVRAVANDLENTWGVTIEVLPVQQVHAPAPTSPKAPVVEALRCAIEDVYRIPAGVGGIGGGTVAAYFRREDYPAAVWSKITRTAHQPNEHCLIENMIGDAKVFAHLFLQESGKSP